MYPLYSSTASGQSQVYLTRYPSMQGRWQVSVKGGGISKNWSPDGRSILFLDENEVMHEVSVDTGGKTPRLGKPVELFAAPQVPVGAQMVPMAADGERFLLTGVEEPDAGEIERSGIKVVRGWLREFER